MKPADGHTCNGTKMSKTSKSNMTMFRKTRPNAQTQNLHSTSKITEGFRSLHVILLYSFSLWGFFGKRPTEGQTLYVSSYAKLIHVLQDKTKCIMSTYLVHENLMAVEYKVAEGYEKADPKTNVVIAVQTTSHGMRCP